MNRTIASVLLLLLFRCDRSMPTEINSKVVYEIPTACGKIECRASYFTGSMTIAQKFFGSNYTLHPKRLRVETKSEDVFKIERLEFRDLKGNVISSDSLIIHEEQSILVTVYTAMLKKSTEDQYIAIPPSDYILCNNKPVITDTLKIKY